MPHSSQPIRLLNFTVSCDILTLCLMTKINCSPCAVKHNVSQLCQGFDMYEFDTYIPASVIYLHLFTEVAEIGVIEDTHR